MSSEDDRPLDVRVLSLVNMNEISHITGKPYSELMAIYNEGRSKDKEVYVLCENLRDLYSGKE